VPRSPLPGALLVLLFIGAAQMCGPVAFTSWVLDVQRHWKGYHTRKPYKSMRRMLACRVARLRLKNLRIVCAALSMPRCHFPAWVAPQATHPSALLHALVASMRWHFCGAHSSFVVPSSSLQRAEQLSTTFNCCFPVLDICRRRPGRPSWRPLARRRRWQRRSFGSWSSVCRG